MACHLCPAAARLTPTFMSGPAYIIVGGVLMVAAAAMLWAWLTGKAKWCDSAGADAENPGQTDVLSLCMYFLVTVIAPLMAGALMIAYGIWKL